jgi:CO dehydrogenase nickel-insertion accessory protein CooC1
MCILSAANIYELITSCAESTDELIIDLSCACDTRTRKVFELANKILLVTEQTVAAAAKLAQFTTQNNVFEEISEKVTFVANKGAALLEPLLSPAISLPFVESTDGFLISKALAHHIPSNH